MTPEEQIAAVKAYMRKVRVGINGRSGKADVDRIVGMLFRELEQIVGSADDEEVTQTEIRLQAIGGGR